MRSSRDEDDMQMDTADNFITRNFACSHHNRMPTVLFVSEGNPWLTDQTCSVSSFAPTLTPFAVRITARPSRIVQQTSRGPAGRQTRRFLDRRRRGIHRRRAAAVLLAGQVEVRPTHDAAVLTEAVLVTGLQPPGAGSALEAGDVEHEVPGANDEL